MGDRLLQGVLAEMGFTNPNPNTPGIEDIYGITLPCGLEVDVSCVTGEGRLWVHDAPRDVTVAELLLQFEGVGQLKAFVDAVRGVTFYKGAPTPERDELHIRVETPGLKR